MNSIGVKMQRKRAPSWKPKLNNFIHIEPATSKPGGDSVGGSPLLGQGSNDIIPRSPHLAKELTSGLSQYLTSTPKTPIAPGMKRPFNFINCSPSDWSMPTLKRNKLFEKAVITETLQSDHQDVPKSSSPSVDKSTEEDMEVHYICSTNPI